ncbi:hypothetical protein PBI_GRAYSON_164 [Rhodococcus phage Grayson]|jgi:hypothetical protein|nr:hypothetical protein PBI_GRAYSON_164 [Rhodococcus phage Grayson]
MNLVEALHKAFSEYESEDPQFSNYTEYETETIYGDVYINPRSVRMDGLYNLEQIVDRAIELMEVD